MAIRDSIVKQAYWEAADGTWKPEVDEMNNFFTTAGLHALPEDMIRGALYGGVASYPQLPQGVWAPAGGKLPNGQMKAGVIHWCGIFATYVLKRWGGLDAHWVYGQGIFGKGVTKRTDAKNIKPGDVAVIHGKANAHGQYPIHHFIVTQTDPSANYLESVDGNSTNNSIVIHDKEFSYTGPDAAAKNIWYYYRVND